MPAPNLASLAQVKEYIGINSTSTSADELLNRLIASASRFIYSKIDIDTVIPTDYVETRDSYGHKWIQPYNWPILSVTSIAYSGFTITNLLTELPRQQGYTINQPDTGVGRLTIHNYPGPPQGKDLIVLTYRAGFQIDDESQTIPAMSEYTVTTDFLWVSDAGVTLDDGTALTKVTSAPADGEYSVSDDGTYTFNAAQAGEGVLISYGYVPADLNQAVVELVAGTYAEKDRLNVRSKSLGGQETVSYFQNQMTPAIMMLIGPYERVTPR